MTTQFEGHTYSDGKAVWTVEELWLAADGLPVELMRVELFVEQLEGTCWTHTGTEASPNWVLEHTRRILDADMDFPIIIDKGGIVLDGIHRLCKAVLEGREFVSVQRLVQMPSPTLSLIEEEPPPLFI